MHLICEWSLTQTLQIHYVSTVEGIMTNEVSSTCFGYLRSKMLEYFDTL